MHSNNNFIYQKPMFIPNNKLEMSFINFFSNFRKSYIGKFLMSFFFRKIKT